MLRLNEKAIKYYIPFLEILFNISLLEALRCLP